MKTIKLSENIFILLIILFIGGCNIENQQTKYNQEVLNTHLLSSQNIIYESWGDTLNNNIKIQDNDSNSFLLKDLVNNEQKLIFRFTDVDCNPCIENGINILKKLSKKIDTRKVVILASCSNIRHFQVFCEKAFPFKVYLTPSHSINIPIEDINQPYFFILPIKSSIPICYFIPKKELEESSNLYIDVIFNKYKFLEK